MQNSELGIQNAEHAQAELFLAIKGLLAETVAFREHFKDYLLIAT